MERNMIDDFEHQLLPFSCYPCFWCVPSYPLFRIAIVYHALRLCIPEKLQVHETIAACSCDRTNFDIDQRRATKDMFSLPYSAQKRGSLLEIKDYRDTLRSVL